MTDDKKHLNVNDRPEQAKPEQVSKHEKQSQAATVDRPEQRMAPGRRPLFRT